MPKLFVTEALPVRTQFLIFTLFGEYVVQRGGKIWTSSLLYLLGLLGISERAVRSTLSRMTRKGWVISQKYGRRSQYIITPLGRELLEQGRQRIFESIFTDWDHRWHLVVYSLPEGKRRRRHALRQNLTWMGFGRLAPGTWISPHNRCQEMKSIFEALNLESYVDMFSGLYLGPSTAQELVFRCWDIDGLENQYREFIERYQPEYERCKSEYSQGRSVDLEKCFVRRFWLTHEFQSFPLKDPNLPTLLLSPYWVGFSARELFDNYRHLLGRFANQFIDEVMHEDGYQPVRKKQTNLV